MKKIWNEVVTVCLLAILPAAVAARIHPSRPNWSPQTLQEGEVLIETALGWQNILWVDARSIHAFENNRIPGAVLLNEDTWEELLQDVLAQWQPHVPVVVYCSSQACQASHRVAQRLRQEVGLDRVFVLKGGWEAWQNAARSKPSG